MVLLSAVALVSLAICHPTIAWHNSFHLKGRSEIQSASNNVNVHVDASDQKDGQRLLNWRIEGLALELAAEFARTLGRTTTASAMGHRCGGLCT